MTAETVYEQLAGFLESDPENSSLLADCAEAAMQADKAEEAAALYQRLEAIEPLAGANANAAGIAAMRSGDQETAQLFFARLLEEDGSADPAIRFNLAWSKALARDFAGAQEWLDAHSLATLPQAAMLDLQIDHELGRFDEAGEKLDDYLARFPDYAPLQAAASVLAMDIDRPDLARAAAGKAGDHPDALTTLATLDLGDRKLDEARMQYAKALESRPHNPRAEIGLGLVDLAEGRAKEAGARLDKGAEQFEDHLGSWIAAGWAYFISGDTKTARARFETALDRDDTFGEAHGSLAVVELLEGESEAARRRIEIASRLDRDAFSTALARMLLEQSQGNAEKAEQIFRIASQRSILPDGSTLMDQLVKAMGR